jgi:hypothetical protein
MLIFMLLPLCIPVIPAQAAKFVIPSQAANLVIPAQAAKFVIPAKDGIQSGRNQTTHANPGPRPPPG